MEAPADVTSQDRTPSESIDRATLLIIGVLGLAAFMSVLDGTIVTAAVGTFGTVFGTPISTIVWVSVGYLLAAGFSLPIAGWAIERFGGRRVFLLGLCVFLVGSVLASIAWSASSLIAFRVLQGFGGGLLEPTALTLAATVAGPKRIGRVMGLMSSIINVAPVLGPLTGGLFATESHWRWIFLINLPIGAIVISAAWFVIPRGTGRRDSASVDLAGLLMLSPGFVAVLFAIDRLGARAATWTALLPAAVGVTLFVTYVRHALRIPSPVIDVRLLTRRAFASSVIVMAFVGFIMYSQLVALPLFVHRRLGYTGVGQGVLTAALGVGLLVSMTYASRRSDVTGPRPFVRRGGIVTTAGLGAFAAFGTHLPIGVLLMLFVAIGLGFGCMASPTFASVFRTVPTDSEAQATTTLFIVIQACASLGVTVIGLVLSDSKSTEFGPVFAVLALAAAIASLVGGRLPGRP